MRQPQQLNVLDLFSGIGGFSLGLERAGMRTIAFCEIKPFCQQVIAKHWPTIPCYTDIRTLTAERIAANAATGDIQIDVICGGFPCQDVSLAGARAGMDGERSGLWSEYARLIREIRPRFVIVENTPGLLSLGMGTVLGDLAALGYDAEWHCIPACAVGADHIRDRVWIIAYPNHEGVQINDECRWQSRSAEMGAHASDPYRKGQLQRERHVSNGRRWASDGSSQDVTYIGSLRLSGRGETQQNRSNVRNFGSRIRFAVESANDFPREYWDHKPLMGRRLHGIPDRLDRVESLGNAVVPQVVEIIGRAIIESLTQPLA
jgi:DNA (cytosine-5)-methyltransferase 1